MFVARVRVTPKPGVLDPQGKAVLHSLETLGFEGVDDVRLGKYIEVRINRKSEKEARRDIEQMCHKLLANTIIEAFDFDLVPLP
jgi:phosphoribosylformylglycinamidine synthase